MIKPLSVTSQAISEQVLAIQLLAYRVEANIIGFDGIPALDDTVVSIQKSKEQFYGYYEEDALVGVISCSIIETTLTIHRLVVHPVHFRKGIGKALVLFVLNLGRHDMSEFIVWTGSSNYPALKLYRSLGFLEAQQVEVHPTVFITKLEMMGELNRCQRS